MAMTDFRALCAELLSWADKASAHYYQSPDVLVRARAALAESDGLAVHSREPASVVEQPSDKELLELMPQQMRDDLAAAARALAGFDPDNIKAASVFRIILNRHVADHARAVLARWGNYPPQPIPVSERLPEAGDCDAEGRCWLGGQQMGQRTPTWLLGFPAWAKRFPEVHRYWLPAHALPLPSGKVE